MKSGLVADRLFTLVWLILLTALLAGCQEQPLQGQFDGESQELPSIIPETVNSPPEILSLPITEINQGDIYLYQTHAIDPDLDALSWSLTTSPEGMIIDPDSGTIVGQGLSSGEHAVSLVVDDDRGGSTVQEYLLLVNEDPVIFTSPPEYTFMGTPYKYMLQAMDPDGLDLNYSLTAGPSAMTVDPVTGDLEWTADSDGVFGIELAVSNNLGRADSQSFSLTVLPPDGILVISTPVTEGYTTQPYRYQMSVLDSGDTVVHYSLNDGPAGMVIGPDSGLIEWVPAMAGNFMVEAAVMNEHGYMDTHSFLVVVHSIEAMDAMFAHRVDGLFRSLAAKDIKKALQYLTPAAQTKLGSVLAELIPYMDELAVNYTVPVRVSINPVMAEYMVRRSGGGVDRVFMLTFLRDFGGDWKINGI